MQDWACVASKLSSRDLHVTSTNAAMTLYAACLEAKPQTSQASIAVHSTFSWLTLIICCKEKRKTRTCLLEMMAWTNDTPLWWPPKSVTFVIFLQLLDSIRFISVALKVTQKLFSHFTTMCYINRLFSYLLTLNVWLHKITILTLS